MKIRNGEDESGVILLWLLAFICWMSVLAFGWWQLSRHLNHFHEQERVREEVRDIALLLLYDGWQNLESCIGSDESVVRIRGEQQNEVAEYWGGEQWVPMSGAVEKLTTNGFNIRGEWRIFVAENPAVSEQQLETRTDGGLWRSEWARIVDQGKLEVSPLEEGYILKQTHPILAGALLRIGIFYAEATNDIRLRYHMGVRIWNPYPYWLEVTAEPGNIAPYEVLISGLPQLRLINESLGDLNLFEFSMEATEDYRWRDGAWRVWLEFQDLVAGDRMLLAPGELIDLWQPNQAQGLVRTLPDGMGRIPLTPEKLELGHRLRLEIDNAVGVPRGKLELFQRTLDGELGRSVFVIRDIIWNTGAVQLSEDSFWLKRSDQFHQELADISIGAGLELSEAATVQWMRTHDLRSGEFSVSDAGIGTQLVWVCAVDASEPMGSINWPIIVYEPGVAVEPVQSVGSLRCVYWENMNPLALGEVHGADLNALLDQMTAEVHGGLASRRWNVHQTSAEKWAETLRVAHADWEPCCGRGVQPSFALYPDEVWIRVGHALSELIKEWPRPFQSVSEFLNSGVVDLALQRSGWNEGRFVGDFEWVTQGDLLAPIIGNLSVRSDSFILEVNAWCLNSNGDAFAQLRGRGRFQRGFEEINSVDPTSRPFNLQAWRWDSEDSGGR